jgi:hypothetical protein
MKGYVAGATRLQFFWSILVTATNYSCKFSQEGYFLGIIPFGFG